MHLDIAVVSVGLAREERPDLVFLGPRGEHREAGDRVVDERFVALHLGQLDQFGGVVRSEEHTSELVTNAHIVCRLLLEKKKDTHQLRLIDYTDNTRSQMRTQTDTT